MAYTGTAYGDISPEVAGYWSKEFLKRGQPELVIERFSQTKPVPPHSTKVAGFRKYNALDATPNALDEGVTGSGKKLTKTDITATLVQYGDHIEISDVVQDTHTDPVMREATTVLGEQAAQMCEIIRFGELKAGASVLWANGLARDAVNTKITRTLQRKVTRVMKAQLAKKITSVVKSTPSYGTEQCAAAYVCLCHSDCESDVRDMDGFVPVEKYDPAGKWPTEIGKVEDVRYLYSTIFEAWADAGGDAGTMLSTSGSKADVYPYIYMARDAFATVALKGKNAIVPMVLNPNVPRGGDPYGQRGTVAWKTMMTAKILNDLWMYRLECGVTD